jgi:hypothetical protein
MELLLLPVGPNWPLTMMMMTMMMVMTVMMTIEIRATQVGEHPFQS